VFQYRSAPVERRTGRSTVLVVDDDPSVQMLIRYTLEQAGYDAALADSAESALALIRDIAPAAAFVDWNLPGMSGLSLLTKLRLSPRTANIAMILVSGNTATDHMVMGLEQGADDYVTKPFSPRELLARMRAVMRLRVPETADDAMVAGPLGYDPLASAITLSGDHLALPNTEFKLLKILMAHPHRVFSRTRLLDLIWGEDVFVEERTVDVHVRRLRLLLAERGQNVLIRAVRGGGYKLIVVDPALRQDGALPDVPGGPLGAPQRPALEVAVSDLL
jgi:two-component system phosphate regulon response regulator PhoB